VSSRKRRKEKRGWAWVAGESTPGAPPHHIRKKEKNKPIVKRYLIGQVVKGERLFKKKNCVSTYLMKKFYS
jgi:hypothetical protein